MMIRRSGDGVVEEGEQSMLELWRRLKESVRVDSKREKCDNQISIRDFWQTLEIYLKGPKNSR